MVKPNFEERRSWIRAKRVLSIELRLVKTKRTNADRSWHLTTTQDMSIGGLAFYTDREFKLGEVIELRVIMSGVLDIFNGFAEIVRIEKKETGVHSLIAVEFMDKNPPARKTHKKTRKIIKSNKSHRRIKSESKTKKRV